MQRCGGGGGCGGGLSSTAEVAEGGGGCGCCYNLLGKKGLVFFYLFFDPNSLFLSILIPIYKLLG